MQYLYDVHTVWYLGKPVNYVSIVTADDYFTIAANLTAFSDLLRYVRALHQSGWREASREQYAVWYALDNGGDDYDD